MQKKPETTALDCTADFRVEDASLDYVTVGESCFSVDYRHRDRDGLLNWKTARSLSIFFSRATLARMAFAPVVQNTMQAGPGPPANEKVRM